MCENKIMNEMNWNQKISLQKQIRTILFDARSFMAADPADPIGNDYGGRAISLISLKRVVDGVSRLPEEFLESHPEFPWQKMLDKWDKIANAGPGVCNYIVHYDIVSDLHRLERIFESALR